MNSPSISVVVPAFNCEKTISKTIEGIFNQSHQVDEIIIVDDGSTDKTPDIVKPYNCVYIKQKNSGPAVARNKGAEVCKGEIIFFTDSDCIPNKDWIEKSIKHFEKENVGVVAGSYDIANEENVLARCIHKEIVLRHHNFKSDFVKAFGSYNFGIKKEIFKKVNGFNCSYPNASGEDNDLSYKILKAGFKIYFEKESLVKHYHPTKLIKYLKEQFRHGFFRVQMYVDHPEMMKGDDYTNFKDIVEVPLVGLVVLSLLLTLFFFKIFSLIFIFSFVILLLIELCSSMLLLKNAFEAIYYFFVMSLRAFARTIGFTSGIFCFPVKKK